MFATIRLLFLYLTTAFYVAIFIIVTTINKSKIVTTRKWICKRILEINNIHYEVKGLIDPTAQLLIANHQSFLDIILMEHMHPGNIAWVAKKELFNIPFYGRTVKNPQMIGVDREDKQGLLKLLADVKHRISLGRPVAIFPEGTRSKNGAFLPFKSGAQLIANKLDLRVQPFVVSNTKSLIDMNAFKMYKGPITITALPSLQAKTQPKTWLEDTKKTMESIYHDA